MKVNKKVIDNLTKCYSICPLTYKGREHILVAAEKQDPCYLYDLEGSREATVWERPGGVMSMVQVPESDGVFLATHEFYSPNDSKRARIVIVSPDQSGHWEVRTLADLPHVHRFDIVRRNGVNHLIACVLKSGHEFKDDWTMPGKVYAAALPDDLSIFGEEHQMELTVVKDNMLKNHGYYKIVEDGIEKCIISCDGGVYLFIPPSAPDGKWEIEKLLDEAASDAVLIDMDGDGEKELITISPFHGADLYFYKKIKGKYQKVYTYDKAEFAHAIFAGSLLGKPSVIIGHRQGERNLLLFTYDEASGQYKSEILDRDCGPANVYKYERGGKDVLISANREIDEIAMYTFEK